MRAPEYHGGDCRLPISDNANRRGWNVPWPIPPMWGAVQRPSRACAIRKANLPTPLERSKFDLSHLMKPCQHLGYCPAIADADRMRQIVSRWRKIHPLSSIATNDEKPALTLGRNPPFLDCPYNHIPCPRRAILPHSPGYHETAEPIAGDVNGGGHGRSALWWSPFLIHAAAAARMLLSSPDMPGRFANLWSQATISARSSSLATISPRSVARSLVMGVGRIPCAVMRAPFYFASPARSLWQRCPGSCLSVDRRSASCARHARGVPSGPCRP